MDLTVIILNWNALDWLERSVGSALAQDIAPWQHEVIFVDNASADGSADFVRERFPDARVMAMDRNLGFAGGNNTAIREARGRYILLLNPDTETHPGAFRALIAFMDAHPDCAIAGPQLLNPDGSLQYSCRRFPTLEAGLFRNTPLGRLFPGNRATRDYMMKDVPHDRAMEVDWVSGAAMCIRRETLDRVGLLDEGYFMYVEDVDLCYRAREVGGEVWYEPEAVVTHAIGQSSDKNPAPMIVAFHRSMFRFFRMHYLGARYPAWLTPIVAAGLAARAGLTLARSAWDRRRRKRGPQR